MRRPWFLVAAIIGSPAVAALVYAFRFGGCANAYFLSILLGCCAFTWSCNQLVLASRPHFLVSVLGKRGVRNLHTASSVMILAAATLHGLLKVGLLFGPPEGDRPAGLLGAVAYSLVWGQGFRRASLPAFLGQLCWAVLAAGLLLTVVFMAPGFWGKLGPVKRLRGQLFEQEGAAYRRFRHLHRAWAALVIALLFHVLVSSSTSLLSNPVAAVWLLAYLAASLALYFVSYFRRLGTHPADHLRAAHRRLRAARNG